MILGLGRADRVSNATVIESRAWLRRAAVWIGLAGVATGSAGPAAAETRGFDFQVAWGNFTLAEARVQVSLLGERYSLRGSGQTEGLLGLFVDWEGRSQTDGIAANGRMRPLRHSHQGTWRGETRRTEVDWSAEGAPRVRNEPPPDETEVTPVPETSTLGTVDPFTVVLMVSDSLKKRGRCEARAKVWDGRRRYDLRVDHEGAEVLVADRPWSYAGRSVKCRLSIERIGGFRREAGAWKAKDDSGERAIWVADIGGGTYAPVRAELETAFGTVVGRLRPVEAGQEPKEQAELERASPTRRR